MEYLTVSEVAARWGVSARRVRLLCAQGKILGAVKEGRGYLLPADAVKPADGRKNRGLDIPAEYRDIFTHVDALLESLNSRRKLTAGEIQRLNQEFTAEFTHNSTAIEGNTLTLQETAAVLQGLTIGQKPLKDHLEAVGQRDAFKYIEKLATSKARLTEWEIKNIHSLVLADMPQDKGIYRRIPVQIVGAYRQPLPHYSIAQAMEKLLAEHALSRKHPIEKVALFHLEFEGIHPFIDGNGRAGRTILNLDLMRHGYPPINIKYADRVKYYECFDAYFQYDNPCLMVNLVAGYLREQLNRYLDILR